MRLVVPLPLHSGEPSAWLFSIDPEESKTTRTLGRSDCARAAPAPSAIIKPQAPRNEATPRALLVVMRGVPRSTIDGAAGAARRADSVARRIGDGDADL